MVLKKRTLQPNTHIKNEIFFVCLTIAKLLFFIFMNSVVIRSYVYYLFSLVLFYQLFLSYNN